MMMWSYGNGMDLARQLFLILGAHEPDHRQQLPEHGRDFACDHSRRSVRRDRDRSFPAADLSPESAGGVASRRHPGGQFTGLKALRGRQGDARLKRAQPANHANLDIHPAKTDRKESSMTILTDTILSQSAFSAAVCPIISLPVRPSPMTGGASDRCLHGLHRRA